jgi:hypothetical protein
LGEKIQVEPGDATLRYQAGMLALELEAAKAASDWFQSVFWIALYHRRRAEGMQC